MGLNSIGYIAVILVLFYYVFAILGMILFAETDPWQFGTLDIALITLFRCSTLEDWTDVMYTNMYGCDVYGYGHSLSGGPGIAEMCTKKGPDGFGQLLVVIYFLIFVTIGALVLLTLFIGVVTTSMEEATQDMKAALEVEKEVERIMAEQVTC